VLGTSFNINSYADEANIKTTLINGKVKVTKGGEDVVLKPGQQATIAIAGVSGGQPGNAGGIVVKSDADLSQTLAWKNGLFNFNGLTVRQVLNQLARWYDIKVEIQGKEPDFRFMGEMYRNVNLSDVLEMLEGMGVKYELKGKTLIIL
jgi:ferric-dicitrate binding protein FerR (iron transport regulator)